MGLRWRWTLRGLLLLAALAALLATPALAFASNSVQLVPVSVDPTTDPLAQHNTELEVDSAVNGSTIVGVYQVGRFNTGGSAAAAGFATSSDGGANWTSGILPGLTAASTPAGPHQRVVDENVAYDAAHGVWLIPSIPVNLVGSNYQDFGVLVSRSTDGGVTWSAPVTAISVNQPDKQWTVCDNNPFGNRGTCYMAYSSDSLGFRVQLIKSTDGGLTWSAPVNTGISSGYNVQPVVLPDDTLVIVATDVNENNVIAIRSTNGGATFSSVKTVSTITKHKPSGLRVFFKPSVDLDASGRIWVAWADCRFRTSCATNDIVLTTSTDGLTWSSVTRVPIDSVTSKIDHVIPALGIDQATPGSSPRIGIEYDEIPVNPCGGSGQPTCQMRSAYVSSGDGGATWSSPASLGPDGVPFTFFPQATPGSRMPGDYESVVFVSGNAVVLFPIATLPVGSTYHLDLFAALVPDPLAPVSSRAPAISGSAQQGQTLTSTAGAWGGNPAPTVAEQWQRCDAAGSNCVDIGGATATSYVVGAADVGSTIAVLETASNSAGTGSVRSSATAIVVAASPVPTTPVLDDFNRADNAGPPGPDWSHQPAASSTATSDLAVVGNRVSGNSSNSNADYWNSQQFGSDSEAYVTVAVKPSGDLDTVALGLREQNPDNAAMNGYQAYFYNRTGTDKYEIGKRVVGAWTTLASVTGPELAAGNKLWFRAVGNKLELRRLNGSTWSLVLSVTDSTFTGGGYIGLAARSTVVRLDDFGGGSIGQTGTPPANTSLPTVSGTAQEGQTLSASAGTWSGSPAPTFAYQWQRCDSGGAGCADVAGQTATTYLLGAADVGSTVRVVVTGSNASGSSSAASTVTGVVTAAPSAPVNTSPPTVTGTPQQGQTLSASAGTWSGSPAPAFAYQWQRCDGGGASCSDLSGETGTSYVIVAGDVGSTLRVVVTGTNGSGSSSAASATTAVVTPPASPPANTSPPTVSGTAQQGQTLTASPGTWSGSPVPTFTYQWQRCDGGGASCSDLSGETGTSYVIVAGDVGSTLRVVVTGTNGSGSSSAASVATAVVAPAPTPPVNSTPPTVSGTAQQGQTLTASPGTWSGSPAPTFTYQWQRCDSGGASCSDLSGETGTSYVIAAGDVGSTLRVVVTGTNGSGSSSAASVATAVVAPAPTPPVNSTPPTASGTAQQGQTLTASPGTWSGSPPPTFGFQWQRCDSGGANCADLNGQTGTSYAISSGDVGSTLRVVVTGTNGSGSSSASSAVTAVVSAAASPPANTSPPTVTGSAQQGQVLTGSTGTWSGSPPPTFAYQWQRCTSGGTGCADIGGATSSTHTLVTADVGRTLRVVVTASNSSGSAAAQSAVTATVTSATGPITGLLDDFNRPDNAGPPSASWAHMLVASSPGTTDLKVVSNQATGYANSNADFWTAQQFGPDSEAWVTVAAKPTADFDTVFLDLRLQNAAASSATGYQAYFYNRSGTDQYQLGRRDNGSFVGLGSTVTGPELTAGDKLLFRIIGTRLEFWVFHNSTWTRVVSVADGTYTAAGNIGLGARNSVVRLDDFGGGTVP